MFSKENDLTMDSIFSFIFIFQKRLLDLLVRVLSGYKSSDIEATVKILNTDEQDILLKFIYKGFSEPTDNSCGSLLSWHEKV